MQVILYIDPGTGSMLFTVLIGILGAFVYTLRMLWIKLRFRLSGGKSKDTREKHPFVIFSDDKRYWNIFAPICRELGSRGIDTVYMTQSPDDPALTLEDPHVQAVCIGKENRAFTKLNYLRADVLLSTTPGLDVYQWKRSPDVKWYVHIPHAPSDITLYRMFGLDYYDAVLLSGDYQIEQLRQLEAQRELPPKELVKVGIPYMDVMAERLAQAGPVPEHPTTVLLAPSWGKSALFSVYGGEIIRVLLETGYHVIVRPHPQSFASEKELMDSLQREFPESDQLEWNRDTDNFQVLRRSDILISDFSGVIFEFSLIYDKPVIYTDPNFDLGLYDAWWLKDPLWTVGALPRIGEALTRENMPNLKSLIDTCLTDARYGEGRHQVMEETWAYRGQGAKLAADYLEKKLRELNAGEKE